MAAIGWKGHAARIGATVALGLAAGLVAGLVAPPEVAAAIGWDVGALGYAAWLWLRLSPVSPDVLKTWSAEEDDGRAALTLLFTLAVGVSFTAIFAMIRETPSGAVLALAAVTIIASFLLLHTVFAAHYAHRCYADGPDRPGLDFPGEADPDFLDFAYYAFTIGMTFQTSDVETRSAAMRRLTLVHGVASFFFNTVIIAISVGLASSLMGGG
ncbi:DUF1345 domain-containing protein [Hansschlegelia sp. KR7-227]|jgi:uncharacterized membrane protein|uniref:DUF1345 domain-containing protein n=1 Tax=Hansschlegelia sp. KR7-227 TaxID=3400914 RepID=UPI003C05815D